MSIILRRVRLCSIDQELLVSILADEMGLGKTIMIAALLHANNPYSVAQIEREAKMAKDGSLDDSGSEIEIEEDEEDDEEEEEDDPEEEE